MWRLRSRRRPRLETAAFLTTQHPDYGKLAARIAVSNLHKQTDKSFSPTRCQAARVRQPGTTEPAPLISDEVHGIIQANADRLDAAIIYDRDFEYDYFGFKTLEKSYLLKMHNKIAERLQQMLMRVSVGIHKHDLDAAIETYHMMSEKWFTHATPTMFNAGTPYPQMSSCFLLSMKEDSIDGIFDTLKLCAQISKSAGGIGLSVTNVRAKGSYIKGSGGTSNGLTPMLRVYDNTARYVDQGGGKRKGAFAIYLEPWHADVVDFLDLKKNHGKEEARARDLFYALWIPDLFMKPRRAERRVVALLPQRVPRARRSWGADFDARYEAYEREGKARKNVAGAAALVPDPRLPDRDGHALHALQGRGQPKSNQQNLGTIRCSNLCTEIIEYTSPDEVAVCNLASIALPRFVRDGASTTRSCTTSRYIVAQPEPRHRPQLLPGRRGAQLQLSATGRSASACRASPTLHPPDAMPFDSDEARSHEQGHLRDHLPRGAHLLVRSLAAR